MGAAQLALDFSNSCCCCFYDAAKQSSGVVGGPYYAACQKLFEACQNLRALLSSGQLSPREQQIVNLAAWPRFFATTIDGTPFIAAKLARVWRSAWKLTD